MIPAAASHRVQVLDGVRGLAILMVLLLHCVHLSPTNGIAVLINRAAGLGWLGVDLFFVLSGYLITGILLRERGGPNYFRNFYARRALRIFPAYYFVLAVVFLTLPLLGDAGRYSATRAEFPYLLVYLQNWLRVVEGYGTGWPVFNHMWSLAIEEQFYLLWPLLVLIAPRSAFPRICLWLVGLAIFSKLVLLAAHAGWHAIYMSTTARVDALAIGAWIATLQPGQIPGVRRWFKWAGVGGMMIFLAIGILGLTGNSRLAAAFGTTAGTFVFGWLLFAIHSHTLTPRLAHALDLGALRWLGRYSYGIYLLHYPVYWPIAIVLSSQFGAVDPQVLPNTANIAIGVLTVAVTLLLSVLMYRLIEAPALRLKDRFYAGPPPQGRPAKGAGI